ncbi:MAG TPA: hypothetical protein VLH58_01915 [Candidatus Methylomirabilis sp.]|nr:hypothetical protein [Candidatus Methylomirabilis sp.]HSC70078.1 hypothetical protein [Candidatus Methylomirabilis sp.]
MRWIRFLCVALIDDLRPSTIDRGGMKIGLWRSTLDALKDLRQDGLVAGGHSTEIDSNPSLLLKILA